MIFYFNLSEKDLLSIKIRLLKLNTATVTTIAGQANRSMNSTGIIIYTRHNTAVSDTAERLTAP